MILEAIIKAIKNFESIKGEIPGAVSISQGVKDCGDCIIYKTRIIPILVEFSSSTIPSFLRNETCGTQPTPVKAPHLPAATSLLRREPEKASKVLGALPPAEAKGINNQ